MPCDCLSNLTSAQLLAFAGLALCAFPTLIWCLTYFGACVCGYVWVRWKEWDGSIGRLIGHDAARELADSSPTQRHHHNHT